MKKALSLVLALLMIVGGVAIFASCGEDEEKSDLFFGKELLTVGSQLDALNGLKKGDADIAIIDSVMAGYYMNETDEFADYAIIPGVVLVEEEYGIAAKKGNESLMKQINQAIIELANEDYRYIAEDYGLESELLVTANTQNPLARATDDSFRKIADSGKLVIGYTIFAPIAYEEGGALIGFDIELAEAVIERINEVNDTEIEIEFVVIDWDQKETLLENGTIDLVWNGMTITEERAENMTLSIPYLANKQVAICKAADIEKYGKNVDEFETKTAEAVIIVEKGSVGEEVVHEVE